MSHATRDARARWVFVAFVALAAYLLVSEHRAHFAQVLPWLFVLACPLMHVFVHHGPHDQRGDSSR